MSSVADKIRDVRLSRASSRKELAAVVFDTLVPLIAQHEGNLQFLKQQYDMLAAKVDALSPKTE